MCKHDFCILYLRAWQLVRCTGSSVTLLLLVSSYVVGHLTSLCLSATSPHPILASAPCSTSVDKVIDGHPPYLFSLELIMPYVKSMSSSCVDVNLEDYTSFNFKYVNYVNRTGGSFYLDENKLFYTNVPLKFLVPHISLKAVCDIAKTHAIPPHR